MGCHCLFTDIGDRYSTVYSVRKEDLRNGNPLECLRLLVVIYFCSKFIRNDAAGHHARLTRLRLSIPQSEWTMLIQLILNSISLPNILEISIKRENEFKFNFII